MAVESTHLVSKAGHMAILSAFQYSRETSQPSFICYDSFQKLWLIHLSFDSLKHKAWH